MTCRLLSALLLTLGLTACNDSPESDQLNQVFLTFYPLQSSFPEETSDEQVVNFKRLLIANGVEEVGITLNQRLDGETPLDDEQNPAYQYAVFRVSFSNSNTFDVYDDNQVFLYTQTVFAEDAGQHYCIAIDENQPQLIESSLEMRFPTDDAETHDFISHCRELYRNQLSSSQEAY
jgi:hypothetical protein